MALSVINDSLNGRWIYYQVGGMTKKMWFRPNETRTIPDIDSMSSLLNAVSLRKFEITQRISASSPLHGLFDVGGNYFREVSQSVSCPAFVVSNTKSIKFNDPATDQTIQIPYNAAQDIGTSDYTLSMWIKVPSSATTTQTVYWQRNGDNDSGLSAIWNNIAGGRINFGFTKNPGSPVINYTMGVPNNGEWYHIAVTNDRDVGMKGFVNGVYHDFELTSTVEYSGFNLTNASEPILFGNNSSGSAPYRGFLDEVILMKRALTEAQMTSLYNCGEAIDPTQAFGDVVLWYRMGDGDTFPTITDQTGNEDGTMTNMAASDIKDDTSQNPA